MSSSQNDTVIIKSLPLMEKLVKSRYDLKWDGWDVLHFGSRASFMNRKARRIDGVWRHTDQYFVTENGWEVPVGLIL